MNYRHYVRPRYRTLTAISEDLGLSESWLKEQADAGLIPFIQVGKRRLFNADAVQASLDQRAAAACAGDDGVT